MIVRFTPRSSPKPYSHRAWGVQTDASCPGPRRCESAMAGARPRHITAVLPWLPDPSEAHPSVRHLHPLDPIETMLSPGARIKNPDSRLLTKTAVMTTHLPTPPCSGKNEPPASRGSCKPRYPDMRMLGEDLPSACLATTLSLVRALKAPVLWANEKEGGRVRGGRC